MGWLLVLAIVLTVAAIAAATVAVRAAKEVERRSDKVWIAAEHALKACDRVDAARRDAR